MRAVMGQSPTRAVPMDARLVRWVLSSVAYLTLPVAMYAPKGLAPLFATAALALVVRGIAMRRLEFRFGPFGAAFSALVLYSVLSMIWSIAPLEAVKTAPSLAAMGYDLTQYQILVDGSLVR